MQTIKERLIYLEEERTPGTHVWNPLWCPACFHRLCFRVLQPESCHNSLEQFLKSTQDAMIDFQIFPPTSFITRLKRLKDFYNHCETYTEWGRLKGWAYQAHWTSATPGPHFTRELYSSERWSTCLGLCEKLMTEARWKPRSLSIWNNCQ